MNWRELTSEEYEKLKKEITMPYKVLDFILLLITISLIIVIISSIIDKNIIMLIKNI